MAIRANPYGRLLFACDGAQALIKKTAGEMYAPCNTKTGGGSANHDFVEEHEVGAVEGLVAHIACFGRAGPAVVAKRYS